MWLVSTYSTFTIALPGRSAFALIFYTVGSTIVLAGVLTFRRMKTTVNPLTPEATTTMVTSGIYRFTRNPMYLGFLFILAGWAIDLSNLLAFAFLPLFVWYMNRFQILPEERALASKFSEPFTRYKRSVRRWL
ncbi:MAG: isoprenylcysteine carboxylmethyltransferase family protein [Nitrospira sp.]|nr:isoprenylcysteine carboxylmethyltransferase family protein [Nitrospira sp.]